MLLFLRNSYKIYHNAVRYSKEVPYVLYKIRMGGFTQSVTKWGNGSRL